MRVAFLFPRDPFTRAPGVDVVRLEAVAAALGRRGVEVDIVAPVKRAGRWRSDLLVRPLAVLDRPGGYDLVKVCYHVAMHHLGPYEGPVVARIVRVVDEKLPERDERFRGELLACQDLIRRRAAAVAFNNLENQDRWWRLYGHGQLTVLTPTGCPAVIPEPGTNPYSSEEPVMLFLGSVASPHMAEMINRAARELAGLARIHLLGANKTELYGQKEALDQLIVVHPPRPADEIWPFIHWADLGLALAAGRHRFDNDISKIYSYLRGGLPVLSEELILQNDLIKELGFGLVFGYGSLKDLQAKAAALLADPPAERRREVMDFMAAAHSWEARAKIYVDLFERILSN